MFEIRNLLLKNQEKEILFIENQTFAKEKIHAIIGINAAGKSTFLKSLAGGNNSKNIFYRNKELSAFSIAELAQKRAIFQQNHHLPFPLSVYELIQLGREVWCGTKYQKDSQKVINYLLQELEIDYLRKRNCQALSGGENHRVHLARIFAQVMPNLEENLQSQWLLLDEPMNHLDIRHQYRLLEFLQKLKHKNLTIFIVLHDPIMALNHSDNIILIHDKKLEIYSPEKAVEHLDKIYQINLNCRICDYSKNFYFSPILEKLD